MEVIPGNPWEGESPQIPQNKFFFGVRDLTSDYYQVLIENRRPQWCKTVWSVIIFGLLIFTGYVVYLMLADFITWGSYDRIESVTTNSTLLLPAITICSMNAMNYTHFVENAGGEDSVIVEELDLLLATVESAENSSVIDISGTMTSYSNLNQFEVDDGSIPYTYSNFIYDFILSGEYDYKFGSTQITIENWQQDTGSNELGNCIELNDGKDFSQKLGGSSYGLTFDLDADLTSYLPSTGTQGFKVFIRNHDETILFDQGGYVVAPGTETFMTVKLFETTRLEYPYGSCEDTKSEYSKYSGTTETQRECLHAAKAQRMIQDCQCIPWFIVNRLVRLNKFSLLDELVEYSQADSWDDSWDYKRRRRDTDETPTECEWDEAQYSDFEEYSEQWWYDPYCGNLDQFMLNGNYSEYMCSYIEQVQCDVEFDTTWALLRDNYTCNEPCSYNHYEVAVTSTPFPPTEKYFDSFIKYASYKDADSYNYDYARTNMVRLHIFYEEVEYHTSTQTKDYEIQNFIGELGGVVDLFIGFSFFTVFQLFEISIAKLCKWWFGRNDEAKVEKIAPEKGQQMAE